jgi:S-adenosylmethionine synthetase
VARRLFTSESVTEGHPDKMADQISDAILDAMLKDDPASRVAVETMITTGQVHVAGEVTTKTYVDIPGIIREKILQIGYDSSAKGYDGASCGVSVSIGSQSPDIAQGVTDAFEYREGEGVDDYDRQGAGDQGLMFGYASRETPELMPLPIMLAHKLARQLSAARRSGQVPYLRPDGKTQVTIEYAGDKPVRLDTVVVSSQHAPDINLKELLTPDVKDYVVDPVLAGLDIDTSGYRLLVNPTGRFEIGGPMGDAGLTGRKIIIDTYGGMARHGGGAFSGKDPSKVDRSAAYAMRWVAKNVVAAELADRCEAQVAYAIGKAKPVGLFIECFGTEKVPVERIQDAVTQVFDLRPRAIIAALDLLRPIYSQTAAYGHFGRNEPDFSWERTDRAAALRAAVLSRPRRLVASSPRRLVACAGVSSVTRRSRLACPFYPEYPRGTGAARSSWTASAPGCGSFRGPGVPGRLGTHATGACTPAATAGAPVRAQAITKRYYSYARPRPGAAVGRG